MDTEITPHTRDLIDIVNAEHARTGVITYYPFIHQPTVVVFDPVNDVSRARNCWHAYVVYPRSTTVEDGNDDVPQAKLSSLVERARQYALLRLSAFSGAAATSFLPSLPPSPRDGHKPRG